MVNTINQSSHLQPYIEVKDPENKLGYESYKNNKKNYTYG